MSVKLNELPYTFNALEPQISQKTLEFHYGKHHQKYVDKLNELIAGTDFDIMSLENIVLDSHHFNSHASIFNNAAQAWNHDFYWRCLTPKKKSQISNTCIEKITGSFQSLENFKKEFTESAMTLFGSGWTWMVINPNGNLAIVNYKDADTPIIHNQIPVLAVDIWEHAYYLDYQNERAQYISGLWEIINWNFVEENLNKQSFNLKENSESIMNNSDFYYD